MFGQSAEQRNARIDYILQRIIEAAKLSVPLPDIIVFNEPFPMWPSGKGEEADISMQVVGMYTDCKTAVYRATPDGIANNLIIDNDMHPSEWTATSYDLLCDGVADHEDEGDESYYSSLAARFERLIAALRDGKWAAADEAFKQRVLALPNM